LGNHINANTIKDHLRVCLTVSVMNLDEIGKQNLKTHKHAQAGPPEPAAERKRVQVRMCAPKSKETIPIIARHIRMPTEMTTHPTTPMIGGRPMEQ
jgi:hypothetical protein